MKNPFPGIIKEMRQVTWPTSRETISMFLLVVGMSAVIALIILGLDYFYAEVRDVLLSL